MIQLLCFSGLVPVMAEYRFLDKVKWLDMYGVDLHPVMVSLLDSLSLHCFDTITNFFFVVKLCIFLVCCNLIDKFLALSEVKGAP